MTPKVARLSDEEISRLIAESLEPKPTKPGIDYVSDPDYSPFKVWVYSSWQPRNMVTDPAMTVLLLKELIEKVDGGVIFRKDWLAGKSVERAVAEAYVLAKGLVK